MMEFSAGLAPCTVCRDRRPFFKAQVELSTHSPDGRCVFAEMPVSIAVSPGLARGSGRAGADERTKRGLWDHAGKLVDILQTGDYGNHFSSYGQEPK